MGGKKCRERKILAEHCLGNKQHSIYAKHEVFWLLHPYIFVARFSVHLITFYIQNKQDYVLQSIIFRKRVKIIPLCVSTEVIETWSLKEFKKV